MTDKQKRFADEYLIDKNATQAAIRAGYSEKTAYSQGQRLLKNVEVKKYIDAELAVIFGDLKITREKIIEELGRIGFSKLSEDRDKIKALEILLKRFDNVDDGKYTKLDAVLEKIGGNV